MDFKTSLGACGAQQTPIFSTKSSSEPSAPWLAQSKMLVTVIMIKSYQSCLSPLSKQLFSKFQPEQQ